MSNAQKHHMKGTGQVSTISALILGLFFLLPALATDPERSQFQYEFIGVPWDVDLPSDIVDVVQDLDGVLWLATSRGLARYDGLEMTVYRVSHHPELLSNRPTRLFVDTSNRLFIASQSGLSVYEGGEFRALAANPVWSRSINAFAENNVGTVFIGSDDGLWQYRDGKLKDSAIGTQIEHIHALRWNDDQLIVGARGFIYFVGEQVDIVIELPSDFARSRVRDFAVYRDQVWVATRKGLLVLNGNTADPYTHETLDGVSFNRLLADRDGNLWFISRSNIGRILPNGEVELPDVTDDNMGYVPELTAILEDQVGQVWLTSRIFGLEGFRDTGVTRISYPEGLSSVNVTAIVPGANGGIHVATDQGVDFLEGNDVSANFEGDFSAGASIRTLFLKDERWLWAGAEDGLHIYDLDDGKIQPSPLVDHEVAVRAIAESADGHIWVASDDGLHEIVSGQLLQTVTTSGADINFMLLDGTGLLWLATDRGIAQLRGNRIEFVSDDLDILAQSFTSLAELGIGQIIGVTEDRGIVVYDGNAWTHFGEADGLPPEQLIDVDVDGSDLWIVTGAGIFTMAASSLNSTNVDGLDVTPVATTPRYRSPHEAFCCRGDGDAAAAISDGKAYVATDDGVIYFDLEIAVIHANAPVPYITSFSSAGMPLRFSGEDNNRLPGQNNELRVNYSAIKLNGGEHVEFRYRLLGLSSDWVDNGTSRTVQFQNLPAGNYSFELQASSLANEWSASADGFSFERIPRFFETLAFKLLLWATAIVFTAALMRVRIASTRRRHEQLEVQIRERTQVLHELNSELKSTNVTLRESSQTDPLTGLVNRRLFENTDDRNVLSGEIADHGIVMVIDIDFFKRVNDAYGHAAGDDVLCQFADVLRSCLRQSDLAIRWGGEEFVAICCCPNDDATAMLDRVCCAVREHSFSVPAGKRLTITCSVGAIGYPLWGGVSPNDQMSVLVELADAALYEVKMSGRDGWALLEGGSEPFAYSTEQHIGARLGELIKSGQLLWTSNQFEAPSLSLVDTQSRLRAIKPRLK